MLMCVLKSILKYGDTKCITRLGNTVVRCGILRWGSAQVESSTCAQVKPCGQGARARATKAWYARASGGSTLAAEAQAISATCAASRTPARAIASRGEGRGARPRATDEQLVGVVQGVCALPSRKEGMCCGRRYGPRGRATVAQAACRGEGSTADSGQATGRSARRTCSAWS